MKVVLGFYDGRSHSGLSVQLLGRKLAAEEKLYRI
jgi:hypothetical protein